MEERVIVCFLGISQLSVLCPFEWGQHIGETLNSATKLKAMDYFWDQKQGKLIYYIYKNK